MHCALPIKTRMHTRSEMRVGNLRHELLSSVLVKTQLYRDVDVYANAKRVLIDPASAIHEKADVALQWPLRVKVASFSPVSL
jgi:hypothetical protein